MVIELNNCEGKDDREEKSSIRRETSTLERLRVTFTTNGKLQIQDKNFSE